MSDPTFQTPIYSRNKGSTQTVDTGGSVQVLSGGSIQSAGVISVASGGIINVLSGGTLNVLAGGSIQNAGGNSNSGSQVFSGSVSVTGVIGAPAITLGGTIGKWAFGTTSLASAVGTLGIPGFTRVFAATANSILGEASGAGSTTTVQIDLSLAAAGSIIFHTSIGTLPAVVGGTVSWAAFGT